MPAALLTAQDKGGRSHIDVENYAIDADVNPRTQVLTANVRVRFVPLDDNVTSASFELNNALNVSRIVDDSGRQISASRSAQDYSIRLSFPTPLTKGKPSTLTFTYDGRLTGSEDSPVYGIKFAAIIFDQSEQEHFDSWCDVWNGSLPISSVIAVRHFLSSNFARYRTDFRNTTSLRHSREDCMCG